MTVSADVFDATVKQMLLTVAPDAVLDFGPGAGKYGKMLRELETALGKKVNLSCIEIDKPGVIDTFGLQQIYDNVIHEDAAKVIRRFPALVGEIAIIGDMIEHLTKSEGRDLIEFLQYRFRHIFIIVPIDWISFDAEGAADSHVSIWLPSDFATLYGAYWVERRQEWSGRRFLLVAINGIRVPTEAHFVVRGSGNGEIQTGYLLAPGQARPDWQLPKPD